MKKRVIFGLGCLTLLIASCGDTKKKPVDEVKKDIDIAEVIEKVDEAKKTIKGVVEKPSGLKVEILKPGTMDKTPSRGNKVVVHYAGWLEDTSKPDGKGRKFDSSVDRGQKFQFNIGVGQVIKGWDEGVMDMKVGEKRRLTIPYHLAYGERGIPGAIPPKATLIFEVELFDVA